MISRSLESFPSGNAAVFVSGETIPHLREGFFRTRAVLTQAPLLYVNVGRLIPERRTSHVPSFFPS